MTKYVAYVASNIKGGVSCRLGLKTIIVGANGTGKTAVENSLEVALAAFASQVAGRDEVKEGTLLSLLAPPKETVWARATIVDGDKQVEAKFSAEGAKGKKSGTLSLPDCVDAATVFPLRMARDNAVGSPEKARKHFLAFALPHLTWDDVLAKIPTELHVHLRQACIELSETDAAADRLLKALEYAKKHAAGATKKAKGGTEVAAAAASGLLPLPSEAVIAATADEKKAAQKAWDAVLALEAQAALNAKMRQDLEPLRSQLQQAVANVQQLDGAIQQQQATLAATPAPAFIDEHTHNVIAMRKHCAHAEEQGQAPVACPVCGNTPPLGTFVEKRQRAEAYLAAEQAKAPAYSLAQEQLTRLQANRSQWEAHANGLRTQIAAVENAIAAGHVQPPSAEQKAQAEQRLTAATKAVQDIETLRGQWAQANKVRTVSNDSNKEAMHWAELYEACDKAVQELLDTAVHGFVAKVQAFLPASDTFHMQLRDGDKAVFRYGLLRKGVLHTALSGAEYARVMGAIAGACIPDSDKLSVIIPEEKAFDPQTLAETLQSYSSLPAQVIITSPVAPAFLPNGWTLIDTATGAHRTGTWG